jgi:hypothetical protein
MAHRRRPPSQPQDIPQHSHGRQVGNPRHRVTPRLVHGPDAPFADRRRLCPAEAARPLSPQSERGGLTGNARSATPAGIDSRVRAAIPSFGSERAFRRTGHRTREVVQAVRICSPADLNCATTPSTGWVKWLQLSCVAGSRSLGQGIGQQQLPNAGAWPSAAPLTPALASSRSPARLTARFGPDRPPVAAVRLPREAQPGNVE